MTPTDRALTVIIACPPDDPIAGTAPVRWAIDVLRAGLAAKGVEVRINAAGEAIADQALTLLVARSGSAAAAATLARAGASAPVVPEALALVPGGTDGRRLMLACGSDVRGLVYAVLELADRVAHAADPVAALSVGSPVVQRPANEVRSVTRLFTSEDDDKPWYQDEGFWRRYLSMLVAQRFNRFSLTLGLGYNLPRHVTDAYLYFSYPFLVDVPGYRVRVTGLPNEERSRNLEMLRFISRETVARGLDFQLGLWTHAYAWTDSPDARHTIEGLTPRNHAAYCRDALAVLLEACPDISGLTLRTHGESGIPERTWAFWGTVLDGVVRSGRRVGIDLHAKGLDEETLGAARATGMPLTVSPKYWAEHMGLPYHQAGIRDLERPRHGDDGPGSDWERFMSVSVVSRPFTRYGYGDFVREDRDYRIVFRIWPGTQRLLLWGDPAMAAGFGRQAGLAGSQGLEWFEPLSFRGREGSAIPGTRDGYADPALMTPDDWQKYEYAYRLLGRLTYDPDERPDAWRRHLASLYGVAAGDAELALAHASRILPLVTVAHHPSASNNYYWPELYTDMPIASESPGRPTHHYVDTPAPRQFATVSPLDPEIFSSVTAFVGELLAGEDSGRYSPLDVAQWLERLSGTAAEHLTGLRAEAPDPPSPSIRRLLVDVAIQEALGRFFAGKLRAATLHELAARTGSRLAEHRCLAAYRTARAAWVQAAAHAAGVYVDDLTFGPQPWLRGTWSDRLPAIDRDIDALAALLDAMPHRDRTPEDEVRRLIAAADREPPAVVVSHRQPESFRRGEAIPIVLDAEPAGAPVLAGAKLRYRRLNQAERWAELDMIRTGGRFVATIPAAATGSPYPIQYLFVLRDTRGVAWLYPGLGADLSGQPYVVLRQEERAG